MNNKNCIIWTRVSTKYQEENGGSLDYQKAICERYADEKGFTIKGYFGGTHESAKTPGLLVNAMLNAVKKDDSITHILVSEFDRFSRDAGQSITIISNLTQADIIIVAAKTGMDTSTKEGRLMANFSLCTAQWDNETRTDKFVAGRKHCIENGVWCSKVPLGYTKTGKSLNSQYRINEKGRLIQKAFQWKLRGERNIDIQRRLAALGLSVDKRKLHKILTNPFYAGKIRHKMVKELVDGVQEPLVSYPQFLQVQSILSNRTGVYVHRKETPRFPLKRHVMCAKDHTPLTTYTVKAKNIDYYKCNKQGCCTNVSARKLHQRYEALLARYDISQPVMQIFKDVVRRMIEENHEEQLQQNTLLRKRLTECENKMKQCKVRFGMGEIDEEIYEAAIENLQEKKDAILVELEKVKGNLSNLARQVDNVTATCCKLGSMWRNSDTDLCRKIQNLLFPAGILWDKETDDYRTIEENKALALLRYISDKYKNKKEDESENSPSAVALCG